MTTAKVTKISRQSKKKVASKALKAKSNKHVRVKTSTGTLLLDGQPSNRLKRFLNETPPLAKTHALPAKLSEAMSVETVLSRVNEELLLHSVGELLRLARERKGMTLRDLAQKLEVKHPRIVQLEKAQTAIELQTLTRHADALGYDIRLEFIPREGGEVLATRLG
jgi:ribosome-binding protein aMBF1 (putative translation factor)